MKRLICFITALCILFSLLPFNIVNVQATTLEQALSWAKYQANNNIAYDVDGLYGYQCSDFASAYINYIIYGDPYYWKNNKHQGFTTYDGKEYFYAQYPSGWQRISNTADFIPQAGDILCFDAGTKNSAGHVAVALEGCTLSSLKVVEQDGLAQCPARIRTISYFNAYWNFQGVIRPKFDNQHTHSYSTYDHQGTEHPHYNYYKCSCGDVKENTSETNANLNCISCQNALVEVKKSTYENKFYYLFDEYLTWEQAKTYCETLGGHLATVNSEQEFDFLKNFVADGAKDSYLLGGTDIQTEGQWKWITDEPFVADAWQPWNDGEPNNGQGSYEEDYIEIYKATGKWNDFMGVSANKTCGFICEFEADIPVKTMYYDDKKYSIYDISISWKDAETYCEALGGHLATVQDSGEELFLADLIQYGKKNSYWIGLHDSVNENQWQWVTGEDFIYSDWYEYQPDNSGEREHYVEIRKDFNNQWNDDTIDKFQRSALLAQGFICEFDKPMPIDVKVTKHKNSHELDINLYNNKEGKLLISAYRDDINIEIKEYALSEISDGITLNYSEIDGIKVLLWESFISLKPIMMKEIKASEFIDASKGIWVLKSNLPEGAEVIDTKYTYTLTSYAESAESQMDGWTLYDSEWKESSANSFKYATFPDGFDTNNSYYKTFKTSADSAYETDTEKRTVSTSHSGYIYWHWCRNSYTSGPINRWVEDAYKSTSNGNFFTFHSFDSTTNVTESDGESCYKYSNGNCCKDSYWYYKLPYYTCTTTDYTKIYKFKKTDDLESENYPWNENASNIQEWVCYIG